MFDILTIIPGKKKLTGSGWTSFNAVCCSHFGHKPDRRMRGGLKFDGQTNWTMHCFNCGFKCNFTMGRSISQKTRNLLSWCGIDDLEIQRWSFESLQNKDLLDFTQTTTKKVKIKFGEQKLPTSAVDINLEDPTHFKYIEYLENRGIEYDSYPFKVTPTDIGRNKNRIIVPYFYKDKVVGHTSRYTDDKIPKYINIQQPGYVFNIDAQKEDWQVCIVTEGIFDALSINGVALMHDDISNEQAQLIAQLNRPVIVVPDYDKTGLKIIDRALELGYQVSLPPWSSDVKDVNDAINKYGKLPTLLSILQNATNSKIKIELRKKQIGKQKGF